MNKIGFEGDMADTISSEKIINKEFNAFLQLTDDDIQLAKSYRHYFLQDAACFSKIFYDYLLASSATATILQDYQSRGNSISTLVESQLQHLSTFLHANINDESASHLMHIGKIHYQAKIAPEWVMGAYRLYLDHLQSIVNSEGEIRDEHRALLTATLIKLLFRDMGLMLKGYWDSAFQALQEEQRKVEALQDQVSSLLANIPQILWSVDVAQNRLLYISPNTQQICDINMESPIPCLDNTIVEDKENVQLAWQQALKGERVEVESRMHTATGELRWFRRVFNPFFDTNSNVVRIDGLMEDITESKQTIERLQYLATTDVLTGLANRTLWYDRLNQALIAARRKEGQQAVLMILDLNNFKIVNDTLGHSTGDEILSQTSQRLRAALRESDTLARLGGDEFAVLLPDAAHGKEAAEKIAKTILDCFAEPFYCEAHAVHVGTSIGIAIFPEHGLDAKILMSRADAAMYEAKSKGGGFQIYHSESDTNNGQRLRISADLRHALEHKQFVLRYQPKVDIKTGKIHSVEALLRWRHPHYGLINPADFLPLAERTGMINEITQWVLSNVCSQQKKWHESGLNLPVTVNVSARALHDPQVVENVARILHARGTPAASLGLEVTEAVLMSAAARDDHNLERLNGLGLAISIDNFGVGFSSLSYLKKMPIQSIKIDKSFVGGMENNENDAAIVRSSIELGHNLGLQVVAEGVESSAVWESLAKMGCDYAQGFYISHPLSANELLRWTQH